MESLWTISVSPKRDSSKTIHTLNPSSLTALSFSGNNMHVRGVKSSPCNSMGMSLHTISPKGQDDGSFVFELKMTLIVLSINPQVIVGSSLQVPPLYLLV